MFNINLARNTRLSKLMHFTADDYWYRYSCVKFCLCWYITVPFLKLLISLKYVLAGAGKL